MNEADHFRKEILRMTQAVDEMSSHKEIPPRKTPYQKKPPPKTPIISQILTAYWGCLSGDKPPKPLPVVSNQVIERSS